MPELVAVLATALPRNAGFYVVLMFAGFAIGILGHLAGSNRVVAIGVAVIVLAAFLLPLAVNLTESTPPQIESAR